MTPAPILRALVPAALCALLLGACGRPGPDPDLGPGPSSGEPPARHLVLVTVDTWRGDHFDGERAGTPLTPELARFADSGVRFPRAHSVATETSPGTAGILTGLVPRRSGVVVNMHRLQAEVPSLAPLLRDAGFATAAVVANPVLRPGTGFQLGFDSYRLVPRRRRPKAPAGEVTDAALARVDELASRTRRRLFLWVHYLDPHGPYLPPRHTRGLFPAEAFEAEREIPLQPPGHQSGEGAIPAYQQRGQAPVSTDGRDYLARYAAEVRFVDGEIARLFDGLTERGILEDAVVVLTSDHGEALAGDHGFYFSHGNGLTQDQLRVPLVLRCPGCPAGTAVSRPVSTLDVLPTVLARLGVPPPRDHLLDGTDLLGSGPHLVYGEGRTQTSLGDGDWKAIWSAEGPARLFLLSTDPGELHDLSAEHPERLAELTARLREVRRREILAEPVARERRGRREDRDLRALGYL